MLETGIGRAANLALASLPGFVLPATSRATKRYWTRDITAPFDMVDGEIAVPTGIGFGVDVDTDFIDEITIERRELRPVVTAFDTVGCVRIGEPVESGVRCDRFSATRIGARHGGARRAAIHRRGGGRSRDRPRHSRRCRPGTRVGRRASHPVLIADRHPVGVGGRVTADPAARAVRSPTPAYRELFADDRLIGPVHDALGVDEVVPFTSKLNFKRAKEGSEFPWHQDYPYWYVAVGEDAQDVITAIVFLDDATADNGAVRVIPGSHRIGPVRRDPDDPTRFLTDPAALDPRARDRPRGPGRLGAVVRLVPGPPLIAQHVGPAPPCAPAVLAAGRPPPPARATVPPRVGRRPALTTH